MKNLIFAITLILSINVCAQNEFENTNIFVRVYDLEGEKIGKSRGEGAAGAAIGGITILFKNSKSYEINGDMEKWKAFKEMIIE